MSMREIELALWRQFQQLIIADPLRPRDTQILHQRPSTAPSSQIITRPKLLIVGNLHRFLRSEVISIPRNPTPQVKLHDCRFRGYLRESVEFDDTFIFPPEGSSSGPCDKHEERLSQRSPSGQQELAKGVGNAKSDSRLPGSSSTNRQSRRPGVLNQDNKRTRLPDEFEDDEQDDIQRESVLDPHDLQHFMYLACPFAKHHPARYSQVFNSCTAGPGFPNPGKLVEHLKRVHSSISACPRCKRRFSGRRRADADRASQEHRDREQCSPRDLTFQEPEWMDARQENLFSDSIIQRHVESAEDKWRNIYRFLFQVSDNPRAETPSPYYDYFIPRYLVEEQISSSIPPFPPALFIERDEMPSMSSDPMVFGQGSLHPDTYDSGVPSGINQYRDPSTILESHTEQMMSLNTDMGLMDDHVPVDQSGFDLGPDILSLQHFTVGSHGNYDQLSMFETPSPANNLSLEIASSSTNIVTVPPLVDSTYGSAARDEDQDETNALPKPASSLQAGVHQSSETDASANVVGAHHPERSELPGEGVAADIDRHTLLSGSWMQTMN